MKNSVAKSITHSYDANSNRTLMIDPDGGRFTYAYDNRSALKTLKNPQDDLTTFSYDSGGQRTLKKLANGTRASPGGLRHNGQSPWAENQGDCATMGNMA